MAASQASLARAHWAFVVSSDSACRHLRPCIVHFVASNYFPRSHPPFGR